MLIGDRIGDAAAAAGKGLAAGMVGTAAMTLSSTIEMRLRKRPASTAPADAAAKILGIEPIDDKAKARFSNLVHWAYGTSWGAVCGLLGLVAPPSLAGAGHLGAVWGSELMMLPALGVAPPAKEWGAKELAIDAFHHVVYVTATSLAYAALDRRSSGAGRPSTTTSLRQ